MFTEYISGLSWVKSLHLSVIQLLICKEGENIPLQLFLGVDVKIKRDHNVIKAFSTIKWYITLR